MVRYWQRVGCALATCCMLAAVARAQSSRAEEAEQYAAAGQQALAQGQFEAAQASFEKLAKLEPSIAEVHATLAAICFKQREYEEAIREARSAQRLKPTLPKVGSLLGLSLAEMGHYQDALPELEKGFRQTADSEVRRMCGLELLRAYSALNRDPDAVETSLALNRLYPNDPEVLYHTGRVYGSFAYDVMEKLHDTAPNSVWMLQAQGEANESQKNWDAAIVAFNHVLVLDPKRPGIHYQLGRIYLARYRDSQDTKDRDLAMQEFTAELGLDPQNGNAKYELANIQADLGNLDEARRQYEQVLQQFPDFEEALVGLAQIDLLQQKASEAVPLLERATRIRPDDEVAWWRLARADRATGDTDGQRKALAEFQKIHRVTPVTLRSSNVVDAVTPQQLDANPKP